MNKIIKIGLTLFVALFFLYLLVLSVDVYRMQRLKPYPGTHPVRVFSFGWHSGLVLDMDDIPEPYQRYFAMFKNQQWVEVSWGDNLYYRNRRKELSGPFAVSALFWPTKSVLHVVGFTMPLHAIYGFRGFQTLYFTEKNYVRLLDFVTSHFVSDSVHAFSVIERGLYGDSWFLKSKGTYIFPYTCNVWTAKALKEAGLPITPVLYQMPGLLMRVLRERPKRNPNVKFAFLNYEETPGN